MKNRRWKRPDGSHKYDALVPEPSPPDDGGDSEHGAVANKRFKSRRDTNKGALYHAYDFHVHQFITHLRRVHSDNPPLSMNINGTTVSVKAADPLAPTPVPLYYFHSRTPMYNHFMFQFWDACMSPTFNIICPWFNVTTEHELERLFALSVTG